MRIVRIKLDKVKGYTHNAHIPTAQNRPFEDMKTAGYFEE